MHDLTVQEHNRYQTTGDTVRGIDDSLARLAKKQALFQHALGIVNGVESHLGENYGPSRITYGTTDMELRMEWNGTRNALLVTIFPDYCTVTAKPGYTDEQPTHMQHYDSGVAAVVVDRLRALEML